MTASVSSLQRFLHNNRGILFIAAGQAFLAATSAIVKALQAADPTASPLQFIIARMGTIYIFSTLSMLIKRVPHPWLGPPGVRMLLCIRGIAGFVGLLGLYTSLNFLSLSDSTALSFLGPVATGILAALFLGEVFGRREALTAIISLLGVLLIARPASIFGGAQASNDVVKNAGSRLIGLVGSMLDVWLGSATSYTCVRAIGERAHVFHSISAFSAYSVLISVLLMVFTGTPLVIPLRLDYIALFVCIGIFGCISQTLITTGLQIGPAGKNCTGVYTQIIFAAILERIFFTSNIKWTSAAGTFVILASATWAMLSKQDASLAVSRPPDVEREPLLRGMATPAMIGYHTSSIRNPLG